MKNIPAAQEKDSSELRRSYAEILERFGEDEVPNIVKCFSARPDVLWNFIPFADSLLMEDGHLPAAMRETIATFVSALNGADHCVDSHGFRLKQLGGDPTRSIRLAEGGDVPEMTLTERALLEFARMITLDSRVIARTDVESVVAAGWSMDQVCEAVLIASYFNFMNRMANSFGVEPRGLLGAC